MKFKTSGILMLLMERLLMCISLADVPAILRALLLLSRAWTLTKLSKEWTVSNVAIRTHHVLTSLLKP